VQKNHVINHPDIQLIVWFSSSRAAAICRQNTDEILPLLMKWPNALKGLNMMWCRWSTFCPRSEQSVWHVQFWCRWFRLLTKCMSPNVYTYYYFINLLHICQLIFHLCKRYVFSAYEYACLVCCIVIDNCMWWGCWCKLTPMHKTHLGL